MADKYLSSTHSNNRYQKKRGSVDTALRPERKSKNEQHHHRDTKKDIGQLAIDLNPQKNLTKLSLNRNFTYRNQMSQNSNLCDLREQVQQLRMENQSLRQQVKILRINQNQLKLQIATLKKGMLENEERYGFLETQYAKLQGKTKTYGEKIKELFQQLIYEKKKSASILAGQEEFQVKKMGLSPSNLSICNSLNLRKFQQEGYRDFYNSSKSNFRGDRMEKDENSRLESYHRFKKVGWSHQSSESSPSHRMRGGGIPETFGTKY